MIFSGRPNLLRFLKSNYLLLSGLYRRLQNFTESAPIISKYHLTGVRGLNYAGSNTAGRELRPLNVLRRSPCPEGLSLFDLI